MPIKASKHTIKRTNDHIFVAKEAFLRWALLQKRLVIMKSPTPMLPRTNAQMIRSLLPQRRVVVGLFLPKRDLSIFHHQYIIHAHTATITRAWCRVALTYCRISLARNAYFALNPLRQIVTNGRISFAKEAYLYSDSFSKETLQSFINCATSGVASICYIVTSFFGINTLVN